MKSTKNSTFWWNSTLPGPPRKTINIPIGILMVFESALAGFWLQDVTKSGFLGIIMKIVEMHENHQWFTEFHDFQLSGVRGASETYRIPKDFYTFQPLASTRVKRRDFARNSTKSSGNAETHGISLFLRISIFPCLPPPPRKTSNDRQGIPRFPRPDWAWEPWFPWIPWNSVKFNEVPGILWNSVNFLKIPWGGPPLRPTSPNHQYSYRNIDGFEGWAGRKIRKG